MMKKNPLAIVLGLSVFFFLVFVVITISTVMRLTSPEKSQKNFFGNASNVGVIEVKGVIMESKKLLDQLDSFSEDPLIKAVVIRINSPGGAVAPSQEIYDGIKRLAKQKPVYSSMGSLAASGGYYVACGTKKIFANAGTITGSIGVVMQFANLSKLYDWAKVDLYNIKTGKYKDIGSPAREMTPDEKALLQGMVDNVLSQFRKAVASARNLTMERVIELSDGRIFSGEQAKSANLVDELGGLNEAVEAIAKEAGIKGKPNIVYASKKKRFLEKILGEIDEESDVDSNSSFGGSIGRLIRVALKISRVLDGAASSESFPSASKLIGPLFLAPLAVQ